MTYESSIKSRYIICKDRRISQGDLLEGISFNIGSIDSDGRLYGDEYNLKYAIVMTQDCDLASHCRAANSDNAQDNSQIDRSIIKTVLVCPAYPFDQFIQGSHIDGVDFSKLTISSKDFKSNDKLKRYHYLEADTNNEINNLIIDFKDFYTVPYKVIEDARKEHYVASINELFRENLSQRFANYLSRIGLPDLD